MKNVLISAGDPAVRDTLVLILSKEKYNIKVAMSYDHSIKIIWASPPDIMLVDFECPHVNAPTLLQSARKIVPTVCVVALHSDAAFDKTRHRLKFLITKPFTRQRVIRVLSRCAAA